MSLNLNIWRESVSLIITSKWKFSNNKYNYKILCLKRSQKSKFMPGKYVFPGGNITETDLNEEWLKLYKNFGFTDNFLKLLKPKRNIPTILQGNIKNFPKYLSFRIAAIRETFEECGILICKTVQQDKNYSKWASFIGGKNILKWQKKVNENHKEFLNLCSEFQIYPDIWALNEWSNWATPKSRPIKFDTSFFLLTFDQLPNQQIDNEEIKNLIWATPQDYLTQYKEGIITLPPPQFYEISRLKNIFDINLLSSFAENRSKYGCEQYLPHEIKTNNGLYGILPGDDLYPKKIDKNSKSIEFRANLPNSNIKHRINFTNEHKYEIIIENFIPKVKHFIP